MKEINLSFRIEEINLILTALGNLPFIQVNELIAKIQAQATPQLTNVSNGAGTNNQNKINTGTEHHQDLS
jgi:hypothetical protein